MARPGDEELTHDAVGKLAFDGMHAYACGAWSRLATVTKACRDNGAALCKPVQSCELAYDGLGRRTVKEVKNSADLALPTTTTTGGRSLRPGTAARTC